MNVGSNTFAIDWNTTMLPRSSNVFIIIERRATAGDEYSALRFLAPD